MKMKSIYALILIAFLVVSCNDDDDKIPPFFSGNDITDKASIEINDDKEVTLKVDVAGEWSLYAGPSVEQIDFSTPILKDNKKGDYKIDVKTDKRTYYQLAASEGKAILAERRLPIDSCYHFRDMGGYKTTDGKFVKWGKVFRTDEFNRINSSGVAYLNSLPLKSIIDFRSVEEAGEQPNIAPESVKNKYDLNISIGSISNIIYAMVDDKSIFTATEEKMTEIMSNTYLQFITEEECISKFKEFFSILQNENSAPLVYNCSIGKDRTGISSYLFLVSLGVSEDTALKDYLLTNTFGVSEKYRGYIAMLPAIKPLFEAKEVYIKTAINQIKKDHGSIENFLTQTLNVDLNKMKSLYLY